MEHWELVARESIRDLVARYNANGDSGRFDPMLELFAEDATMELPDGVHRGRSAIRAMVEGVATRTGDHPKAGAKFIRHFTATHQIDLVSPTEAKGRCYYVVLTDRGVDHWGRYVDEYRQLEGRWLFWHRKVTTDGSVPDSWAQR
jgi:uncharacterized protein (TIGR02246 family)